MPKSNVTHKHLILLLGLSLALGFIGSLGFWPASQVQAGATLPPRPTLTRDAPDDDDDHEHTPVGAYIELQVNPALAGSWSEIEWQDSNGNWQPVNGWAGSLDSRGQRRWWVAAKDFGTGPFRWVVRQPAGGSILLTSNAFSLPAEANQTIQIVME